ncbi:MAG TPA: tRNA (guanosine(37)-N1)-methyltransferase TrmD [Patescibacteria group bacterium]|nr:tRNA (guanosine(37)-N1)-methyltransferase TrmD [Patescibacteria group bacterium]
MKITILTLFPEMFTGPFSHSIIKRAKEKKVVEINLKDIRDFGLGKHQVVDDTPYGGGKGMILRVDVLEEAIENARDKILKGKGEKIILLSPHGKTYNQEIALNLSKLNHLILICGHYEGIDARVDNFIDSKISLGDFIVTGGEIPAMIIVDSVTRLLKGVLKEGVTEAESFSSFLEHNQYTKPSEYKGLKVPEVLLSGNHKKIEEYKNNESEEITKKLRPDLIKKAKKE